MVAFHGGKLGSADNTTFNGFIHRLLHRWNESRQPQNLVFESDGEACEFRRSGATTAKTSRGEDQPKNICLCSWLSKFEYDGGLKDRLGRQLRVVPVRRVHTKSSTFNVLSAAWWTAADTRGTGNAATLERWKW